MEIPNWNVELKILDISNCTLKVINYVLTILLPNLIIHSFYRDFLSPCDNRKLSLDIIRAKSLASGVTNLKHSERGSGQRSGMGQSLAG